MCPPGRREAVQISRNFGFAPQASPDGRYLYFFAGRSKHRCIANLFAQVRRIHRVDLTTLKEEPLIENAITDMKRREDAAPPTAAKEGFMKTTATFSTCS